MLLRAAIRESFGATFVCGFLISPFLIINSFDDNQLISSENINSKKLTWIRRGLIIRVFG